MKLVTPDNRVPIQSSGFASHPAAHGAAVGKLGKGRTGARRRDLFVFRSPANQKSPRLVRPESAAGRNPAVATGNAETSRRHGKPPAGGGRLSFRAPSRV